MIFRNVRHGFMRTAGAAAMLFMVLAPESAQSQERGQTAVGLGVGTVGGSLSLAHRFNNNWGIKGVLGWGINVTDGDSFGGVTLASEGNLGGASLLGSYYFGDSGFFASGGFFVSETYLNGTAAGTFTLASSGRVVTTGINAKAEFRDRFAPMATIGYQYFWSEHWGLTALAGVIFTGGLEYTISEVGGSSITDAEIAGELARFSDQSGLEYFPFVDVSIRYQF